MDLLRKYGVATNVYIPVVKRAVVDFAVGADWTPAAGDVKISKDGGATANVTTLPVAIAMGNTAMWNFAISATEMQAAKIVVMVADSATKAVEDQAFLIATYGNASAEHAVDLDDSVRAGLTALPNAAAEAAGGLYTRGAGAGQINQDANGRVDTRTAAMAADVMTAAAAAADLTTELQAGLATSAALATVQADTDDIQARLPAALVGGRIDSSVGAMAAAVLTAAAIAADAITDAKVAADVTIASVTGSVGSVVGAVGSVAAGGITAPSFALDAIDAAALKADAVNEIRDAVFARAFSAAYDNLTFDQLVKLMAAALLAKCSGMATATGTFRNLADTGDTIVATQDTDGNRTAVVRTP